MFDATGCGLGLGADVSVVAGDRRRSRSLAVSATRRLGLDSDVGLRSDLIDDNRFELSYPNSLGAYSDSVPENDRFLDGERNDAGDKDDWRSLSAAIDVIGARRLSSLI